VETCDMETSCAHAVDTGRALLLRVELCCENEASIDNQWSPKQGKAKN
jgi:hypothetical protein